MVQGLGRYTRVSQQQNRPAVPMRSHLLVRGVCGRQFRRSGDLKHHKCYESQSGAVQCPSESEAPGVISSSRWGRGDVTSMGNLQQDMCVCIVAHFFPWWVTINVHPHCYELIKPQPEVTEVLYITES